MTSSYLDKPLRSLAQAQADRAGVKLGTIRLMRDPAWAPCAFIIARAPFDTRDEANTILVQTDWDWPGLASSFGWTGEQDEPDAIERAGEWLHENVGAEADDPGYFEDC